MTSVDDIGIVCPIAKIHILDRRSLGSDLTSILVGEVDLI